MKYNYQPTKAMLAQAYNVPSVEVVGVKNKLTVYSGGGKCIVVQRKKMGYVACCRPGQTAEQFCEENSATLIRRDGENPQSRQNP